MSGSNRESGLISGNPAPDHLCIDKMPALVNDASLITFGVPKESKTYLTIYDVTGSRVTTLKEEVLPAGYYTEKIEIKELPSGIYFIELRQDNKTVSKKIVFLK